MTLEGRKDDKEKIQLELLSPTFVLGVGKVLTFGAKKYAAHNWRKGIALSRLLGACLRHVFAFLNGEDKDPESGISHLYHAGCCLMFAAELYETKGSMVDDRYKLGEGRDPEAIPDEMTGTKYILNCTKPGHVLIMGECITCDPIKEK